jgi:hypothetical protein
MPLKLNFAFPAPVEVVKVTSHNLEEVAEWCGGKVAQTESRRTPGRMDSYVWVPTPKGSKISWAFPGMYITKRVVVTLKDELKTTYSVFRRDYYEKNYFETPDASIDATWGRQDGKKKQQKPKDEPKTTVVNVHLDDQVTKQIEETKAMVRELAEKAGVTLSEEELHATDTVIEGLEIAEAVSVSANNMVEKIEAAQLEDPDFDPRKTHPDVLQQAKELIAYGFAAEDEVVDMLSTDIEAAWKMMKDEQRAKEAERFDEIAESYEKSGDDVIRG